MQSFRRRLQGLSFIVVFTGFAAILLFAQTQTQTNQNQGNARPEQPAAYEVLAKGVVGTPPFRVQFESAPLTLEFRNLVMGRGESETIPVPTNILMELRQGGVATIINQQSVERRQGDFWVVEKGSSLSLKNSGEAAVVRAIYILEANK